MTPSEQALFSSNREKSPLPNEDGGSTDADSLGKESDRNIISASARNDTANRKLVGNNISQQSVNSPIGASTGETGSSGGNEGTHNPKEESAAAQDPAKDDKSDAPAPLP